MKRERGREGTVETKKEVEMLTKKVCGEKDIRKN